MGWSQALRKQVMQSRLQATVGSIYTFVRWVTGRCMRTKLLPFVEADLRAGIQPVLAGNFGREDEASLFVHFRPGGCRFGR
ncbi:MAG: hypothetical protein MZV64_62575 [Ignavibacteriales bacterium]|nr:hypothetical protein [Ignavibacteriales bacterium]